MAADGIQHDSQVEDFPAHQRNYDGFIAILKWSSIAVAIITAIVMFIIAS